MSKGEDIKIILQVAKGEKPQKTCSRVFQFINGKLKMINKSFIKNGEEDLKISVVTTKEEKEIIDNLTEEEKKILLNE